MRTVRIGAVSFLIEDYPHTIELNIARGVEYIRRAADLGCDIVCLPELFRTLNVPNRESEPEVFPGPTSELLAETARSVGINVVATYYVEADGGRYNQATVFDRNGRVAGYYRKVQPTASETAAGIHAGSVLPVIDLDFGRVAVMICLDVYFGEIARIYAHKGAEIVFWPTVTHGPTQSGLLAQVTSRAIDNSIVIVESNVAGHPPYAPYVGRFRPGTGRIIDHNGDILAQTGRRHGVAVAEVDLDEVRLTSNCVLIREPDHFREDMQSITRLDLFAREFAELAESQRRYAPYFASADSLQPQKDSIA